MQEYMGGAAINVSDPVVSYRETVTARSDHTVMAKSPNKHNRMYIEVRPLEEGLPEKIDEGDITSGQDVKERGKVLTDEFGWDKDLTKKIWCFGPDTMGPNMLLDAT